MTWHSEEHYDELQNGSRVYLMGLRSGEPQSNPYVKFIGLTLAGIYIDQAEELEEHKDIYQQLKSRLRRSSGVVLRTHRS